MSTYKKLNRQDVYVSDYVARKQWETTESLVNTSTIETLRGFSGSTPGYPYPSDYRNNRYESLVYNSIDNLYYSDGIGEGLFSGSRDLSLQTSLTLSGSRDIKSEVVVISIPKTLFGTHIEPGTFSFKPLVEAVDKYINDSYISDRYSGENQYIENTQYWYNSNPVDSTDYLVSESIYVDESLEQYIDIDKGQQRLEIIDDGNGALILSGSELNFTDPRKVVGDIIYNQGQVVFSDETVARYVSTYSRHKLRWKSNQPIYTYNVHCKVKDSDLNFTYNPSALSSSNGEVVNNLTGSQFTPYVTTVGLYNDANELIAVAKTGRPIPKTQNTDMTFVVKIDL